MSGPHAQRPKDGIRAQHWIAISIRQSLDGKKCVRHGGGVCVCVWGGHGAEKTRRMSLEYCFLLPYLDGDEREVLGGCAVRSGITSCDPRSPRVRVTEPRVPLGCHREPEVAWKST